MKKQAKKTSNKKKYILIGVGAVALGVGGYFLYKHLQKKNDQSDIDAFKEAIADGDYASITQSQSAPKPSSGGGSKPVTVYNQFPLKYGSKGTTVRDLQTALNKKYGTKIDVDGDWRNQTESALKSKGLPTVLDSETYAKIILGTYKSGSSSSGSKPSGSSGSGNKPTAEVNSPTIAKKLHTAIAGDDIFGAIAALKLIKDTNKYSKVNAEFKKKKILSYDFMTGTHQVSKTVVTGLHDQFSSDAEKKKINSELFRIGLKYNGSQWSLSGFPVYQKIVAIRPTMVWDVSGRRIKVPAETILGNFLTAKNGVTKFVTLDNRYLFVNTTEIKYSHD